MDALTVSFHKGKARIVHPWKPEPPSGQHDEVPGALFSARVFVQSKELRDLLISFTRSGSKLPLQGLQCSLRMPSDLQFLWCIDYACNTASGMLLAYAPGSWVQATLQIHVACMHRLIVRSQKCGNTNHNLTYKALWLCHHDC